MWCSAQMIDYHTYSPLIVKPAYKAGYYRLAQPWRFEALGKVFVVPEGFMFDGDSVPRLPLVYMLFKGRSGLQPPCAHDYLYETGQTTRKEADQVYWSAMRYHGVSLVWAIPHYIGVRIGGWVGWRRSRESDK